MRCNKVLLPALVATAALSLPGWPASAAKAAPASVASKLRTPVTCNFDDAPMREVVRYFRETLDVNVVYDPPDENEKFVTLHVRDMPAGSALHWVTKLSGFDHTVTHNAVYISTPEKVRQSGRAYFSQYEVRGLLADGSISTKSDDGDNDDDSGDGAGSPERQLVDIMVLYTGAENWDHVEVMGVSGDGDDETKEKEDSL